MVVTGKIRRERKTKVQRIKLEWRWAAGRFGQVQTVMPFFLHIYTHYIYNNKNYVHCKILLFNGRNYDVLDRK